MDEALLEWAAEAMLADADGYWIGHWNYFIYDHPTRGWLWSRTISTRRSTGSIPHIDPISTGAASAGSSPPWQHYVAVSGLRLARALRGRAARRYDVYVAAQLPDMVDRFAAQIRDTAAADPTRPFTSTTT